MNDLPLLLAILLIAIELSLAFYCVRVCTLSGSGNKHYSLTYYYYDKLYTITIHIHVVTTRCNNYTGCSKSTIASKLAHACGSGSLGLSDRCYGPPARLFTRCVLLCIPSE